ncbi:MAG TPA: tetratricopeptide repeat protein [Candidatus Lokiarchaeia archaeon]|nr:tetratricopeptide repeat protein [Candidatus Lokiarchaeia archaeon]
MSDSVKGKMEHVLLAMQLSRWDEALKWINDILEDYTNHNYEVSPSGLEFLKYKFNICLQLKNMVELEKTCNQIIQIDPGDAKVWFTRGIAYLQFKNVLWAKTSFEKATELDPGNTAAWLNLGALHADAGELTEAITCFDKVLEIDPSNEHVIEARNRVMAAAEEQGIQL